MSAPRRKSYDAIIAGGGLIGLACAWRAAQRGLSVLVLERGDRPGPEASSVAAGMLAPVTEAEFGEEALLAMQLEGRELWPAFAAELEERTALGTGYRESGALTVAADRDDAEELRRLHDFQRSLGLEVEWLAPSAARRLEPGLSPRVAGAIHAAHEGQADPEAVVRALASALEHAGGEIAYGAGVEALVHDGVRVTGVRSAGASISAGAVVVAAGPWSPALAPEGRSLPVRPVKGQILELRTRHGMPEPVERIVRTPRCYLVARGDGRVVLGATVEEQGFDTAVTADGVFRLLEAAWEVLPETGELELVRARAGLRPGTPDNVPIVGRGSLDGLVWATGHWRNGVLLAPLTGAAVAATLAGEEPPESIRSAAPARFEKAAA